MRSTLKIGLIAFSVRARRNKVRQSAIEQARCRIVTAVPLPLKIGLCAFALTASTFTNAEELGRLFFTPEQRTQLDYGYAREARSDNNDRALILNGIVQKHGGKRTIWINGVPQPAGASDEKTPESVPVPVPGQSKSVKLKVGQRVLLSPSANPDTTKSDTPKPDTPKQDTPKQ